MLLLAGCSGHSRYVSLTHTEDHSSRALSEPQNKVLLIYNHGSRQEFSPDRCYPTLFTTPDMIKWVDGLHIGELEIVVYSYCSPWFVSGYNAVTRKGLSKVERRARDIEQLMREFQDQGVPPQQMFLVGHSAGAWASLLVARRGEVAFNGLIGFAPAFSGKRHERSKGWRELRERQVEYLSQIESLPALIYAYDYDDYNRPEDLEFLRGIEGLEFIAVSDPPGEEPCVGPVGHGTTFKSCFQGRGFRGVQTFLRERLQRLKGENE